MRGGWVLYEDCPGGRIYEVWEEWPDSLQVDPEVEDLSYEAQELIKEQEELDS